MELRYSIELAQRQANSGTAAIRMDNLTANPNVEYGCGKQILSRSS